MKQEFLISQGVQIFLLLMVVGLFYLLLRRERNKISIHLNKVKKDLIFLKGEKFTLEDLLRELDHKAFHLFILFHASKTLNSTLDFCSLVDIINDMFIEVVASEGGCLLTQSEDRNTYRLASSKPPLEPLEFVINPETLEWLSKGKEPLTLAELRKTEPPLPPELLDFCRQAEIQTCLPIVYGGQVLALQFLMPKINYEPIAATDKELLMTLAGLVANALQNSILFDMSMYDGLTKIHNYRYFRQRLIEEFRRSKRYHGALSLIIFDLDDFKRFNDTYGHLKGDEILYELAQLVNNFLRKDIDIAARYGGEEFAVILPETRYKDALTVADRLRFSVENYRFQAFNGKNLNLTISLGVAGFPESRIERFEELVGLADKALYQAKRMGKNRVCGVI